MLFRFSFRRAAVAALGFLLIHGPALAQPVRSGHYQLPPAATTADYRPGVLIFRVADAYKGACSASGVEVPALQRVLTQLGATQLERVFPFAPAPTADDRKREPRCVDLSPIYRVRYAAPVAIDKAATALLSTGAVQYAEPDFLGRPRFTPNDPSAAQQYALAQIHALEAWDTQQGDTTVLIGIVDTGVDIDHPDLVNKFQRNYADPINGLDDDNDGYVDNNMGWDFAGAFLNQPVPDNNPGGLGGTYHGTHVAGIAGAETNNGIGVAGVGFKCRILPIKCGADDNGGFILNGYPALVYAADHGCDVINASWGAAGFPDLGQDAINYATFNRGALVVTAAGNNGWADPFSPAGFENVLTVGATGPGDVKAGFSNYGVNTEVFAPGLQIYSTIYNDGYNNNSGTSMASPVVSGAAGLVKAQFPTYTGEQVGQQLRMTCDNIDAQNPTLVGQMGRGRINVLRAITENPSAVRFLRKKFYDVNALFTLVTPLFAGVEADLVGDFKSILKPTTGLAATLSCNSGLVSITQPTVTLGNLATGQVVNNFSNPFTLTVSPSAPADQVVQFTITYQDQNGYSDFEKFEAVLNPSYRDLDAGLLHTTITSKGRIGWNDNRWVQGRGLVYKNHDNLIYEMGLLVGTGPTQVSNTVVNRGNVYPPLADDHFRPVGGPVRPISVPGVTQTLTGLMNDAGAGPAALPVQVRYHAHAWANAPHDKYIIMRYTLRNPGPQPLTNVYAGLYADWDIGAAISNKMAWDATRNLGYAYSNEPDSAFGGIRYLGASAQATFRAIDFDASLPGNPWGISDTFTLAEKWQALSQGVSRATAGIGRGSDVAAVNGAGPFTIAPGDSVTVAFAILGADNLPDLQAAADDAAAQFSTVNGVGDDLSLAHLPAPFPNPSVTGRFTLLALGRSGRIEIFDARATRLHQRPIGGAEAESIDLRAYPAGLYVVRFTDAKGNAVAWRVVVNKE